MGCAPGAFQKQVFGINGVEWIRVATRYITLQNG